MADGQGTFGGGASVKWKVRHKRGDEFDGSDGVETGGKYFKVHIKGYSSFSASGGDVTVMVPIRKGEKDKVNDQIVVSWPKE